MAAPPCDSSTAPSAPRRVICLRRVMASFGLLLIWATWPLWTPAATFPQVPFMAGRWLPGDWGQWAAVGGLLASLTAALVLPNGRAARIACMTVAGGFLAAMLFDQGRFQPWAYQFLLFAIVLATCGAREALTLLRLLVVVFYFESALTKLDYSFLHTLGQQFLAALAGLGGASLESWSSAARLWAAVVFPLGELLVALGLLFARSRAIALAAAVLLHLLLLGILGPWGLDHQPGVLLWNGYFIIQNLVLFWPKRDPEPRGGRPLNAVIDGTQRRVPWPVLALVLAAVGLPLSESWGLFDLWPSWGLYASSAERVSLQVHRVARSQLPASLVPFVETQGDHRDPWLSVRLDRWALDARRAPIYPQARVQLGVALAVAEGAGLADRARFIRFGRADRWTGKREVAIFEGVPEARVAAGQYFFNALPRRTMRPDTER